MEVECRWDFVLVLVVGGGCVGMVDGVVVGDWLVGGYFFGNCLVVVGVVVYYFYFGVGVRGDGLGWMCRFFCGLS